MLDPKKIAESDQNLAQMVETFPAMFWGLYGGCVDKGFTQSQAMQIVLAVVSALFTYHGSTGEEGGKNS